jgi:hypothetical protein
MRKFMFKLLAVFLLSGATTFAGSFTSDFSTPNQTGYTLNTLQDINGLTYPLVTNSELLLLYNEGSLGPTSMVLDDLDNGAAINSFTASFQLQIGPGSSTPADGMAFAFGPDINSGTTFNEEGPPMPSGGICVCFVTYAGDGPGIGVNVRVFDDASATGGIVTGGYVPMAAATMVDSQTHNVWMQVGRDGKFSMVWNGQVLFTNLFLVSPTGLWAPVNGQFAFGGRNGGDTEQILLTNINITTTVAPAKPLPPTVTSDPQSVTVNEGSSASFSVGFDGDAPLTFQWTENTIAITDATNSTLTMMQVSYTNNNAKIACVVSNPSGSKTSQAATLTVIKDTTPPTVTKVDADATFTDVKVSFSKPVNDTALTASNYKVDQGVTVLSVTRVDQSTVTLATSTMAQGATYTLTINGVQDMSATPNTIAANTQVKFGSFVYVTGAVLHKKYNNTPDSYNLTSFLADPRYPNNPDRQDVETMWEYPPNDSGRVAADPVRNYSDTLEGFFIPPTTADYVFFTAGADEFYLYLSTDDSPANMVQICAEPGGWTNPQDWITGQGNTDMTLCRSDKFAGTAWPGGNTISLTKGQRYYMFSMHHDHSWSGADDFAVTYKLSTEPDPIDGDTPRLTGSVIAYYFDPIGASVSFSQQPQSATVLEEETSTNFSALAAGSSDYANGTNVVYQWQLAPKGSTTWTNIAGATTATYSTPFMALADNGDQFRVIASVVPVYATSSVATLTVVADTTPPMVTKAETDLTFSSVVVYFSKPVSDTALTVSNYKVDQGVTISSVTRVNTTTVALSTSTLTLGGSYTLTINGVQDVAVPPNSLAANTQVRFGAFVFAPGAIVHKKYNNCGDGYTLANFLADPRYPNNPDRLDLETSWEYPPNGAGRVAADPVRNYVDTLEGYFIPSTTGNYVFYTCGDDEWYLYLSTDDSSANMKEICAEPGGWSDNRAWCTSSTTGAAGNAGFHSGIAENWVSSTSAYASTNWPSGNIITLNQGSRYYILIMHHDHSWSGGDWFGATFQGPADAAGPADGDATKLTGSLIAYDIDPNGASITFGQEPQSVSTLEGTSANFSVLATGVSDYANLTTPFYQWQLAPKGSTTWTNIAGATSLTYSTSLLGMGDNGTQLRVIASVDPISATSSVATLTVLADTNPPVVSVGAIMDPTAGTVDVGVGFDKTVDDVAGSSLSNYAISSGTITGFTWCTNRFTADSQNPFVMIRKQSALLTVTGLSGGATLTVKNMTDMYGNKLSSTNVSFTVATNLTWGVVGANELGGWNAAVPVGPNGFDLYSDGIAEWATYDEATFVYEKVTGDFDKKVRVAYQDGSSEWARAGLIVRDVLNLGVNRATQTGTTPTGTGTTPPYNGTAGRYQKCHVDPVGLCLTLNAGVPVLANQSWEGNRRLDTGGITASAVTNSVNAVPDYPNAWCRIQRVGQTFTIYRSADGVNWEALGATTWPDPADPSAALMPNTVYVGPEFAPEAGNVTLPADQGTFLAQFRDYGDFAFNPQLTIGFSAGKVTVTWAAGTLVSSPTVNGTYTPVQGAVSPYVVSPPTGRAMFYRVMQ